jgi:sugar lactone lactonase YvrE
MPHNGEKMAQLLRSSGISLTVVLMSVVAAYAAKPVTEIVLPGERLYTESITSLKDGTLIVASLGKGNVSRIASGSTKVEEWIKPGTGDLHDVYGIYADEKFKTLWVCSDKTDDGKGEAAVKAFDLKTGALKASYPLSGNAFCNDIAVADDGTAYVSDTEQAAIVMLKPGAKALETAAKDPLLAGADGLAFGEKNVLYVNSVTTNKLLRVNLGQDGKSTAVKELKLSKPLTAPDGMRTIGKNRLLMAENSGNMDIVTFSGPDGDTAEIQTIKEGLASTPAVTATRGMAWIAEGKLNYRDGDRKGKDPKAFKLYAVPMPKY